MGDIQGVCVRVCVAGGGDDIELTRCPFTFMDVNTTPVLGATENAEEKDTWQVFSCC